MSVCLCLTGDLQYTTACMLGPAWWFVRGTFSLQPTHRSRPCCAPGWQSGTDLGRTAAWGAVHRTCIATPPPCWSARLAVLAPLTAEVTVHVVVQQGGILHDARPSQHKLVPACMARDRPFQLFLHAWPGSIISCIPARMESSREAAGTWPRCRECGWVPGPVNHKHVWHAMPRCGALQAQGTNTVQFHAWAAGAAHKGPASDSQQKQHPPCEPGVNLPQRGVGPGVEHLGVVLGHLSIWDHTCTWKLYLAISASGITPATTTSVLGH